MKQLTDRFLTKGEGGGGNSLSKLSRHRSKDLSCKVTDTSMTSWRSFEMRADRQRARKSSERHISRKSQTECRVTQRIRMTMLPISTDNTSRVKCWRRSTSFSTYSSFRSPGSATVLFCRLRLASSSSSMLWSPSVSRRSIVVRISSASSGDSDEELNSESSSERLRFRFNRTDTSRP